ncbi:MAG: hypothetical protein AAF384_11715 [Pseudomonadota bacterium]
MKRALTIVFAFGFLMVMWWAGEQPKRGQRIEAQAAGILEVPIGVLTRIAVKHHARHHELVFSDGSWMLPDRHEAAGKELLGTALQFLNTANPVRRIANASLTRASIDEMRFLETDLSIELGYNHHDKILIEIGGQNLDGALTYVRTWPSGDVYLLPEFFIDQWQAVVAHLPE